jgi:hypothetical protein
LEKLDDILENFPVAGSRFPAVKAKLNDIELKPYE